MKFSDRKNIGLDAAYRLLTNFSICEGIFVLFLIKRGLPLWQVGLLEAVFHLTGILSEIPTGALADLWGRKWVLVAGGLCDITSSVIMLSTTNFWLLAVSFVFTSWGYNLRSGSEEALVYDSLLQAQKEDRFFHLNSRLAFLAEVSNGLTLLAGGYLAEISYVLCYAVSIGLGIVSTLLCLFFTEPENPEKQVTVRGHFSASIRLIRGNRQLQFVLLHYAILFGFQTAIYLYSQNFYYARGLTESRIGLLQLGVSACSSVGALLSEKIGSRLGSRASLVGGLLVAVGILLMSGSPLPLSIAGYALASMANAALYPLQSNELNRLIPSAQRATILSVSSMCFSMVMVALFPLMGGLMEWLSMTAVFFGAGAVMLLYVAAAGLLRRGK